MNHRLLKPPLLYICHIFNGSVVVGAADLITNQVTEKHTHRLMRHLLIIMLYNSDAVSCAVNESNLGLKAQIEVVNPLLLLLFISLRKSCSSDIIKDKLEAGSAPPIKKDWDL